MSTPQQQPHAPHPRGREDGREDGREAGREADRADRESQQARDPEDQSAVEDSELDELDARERERVSVRVRDEPDAEGTEVPRAAAPAGTGTLPPDGTERSRDELRSGGPRYGGGPWELADERGDQRFGHARNDDADPSELARGEAEADDDDVPTAADAELAAEEASGEIEAGGQREGMRRGPKPRKSKVRT